MATRRIWSKKGKIILIASIIAGVLIIGGSGYLLWRVNKEETVAPIDSEAGGDYDYRCGNTCSCNVWACTKRNSPDISYFSKYNSDYDFCTKEVDNGCGEHNLSKYNLTACYRHHCADGVWILVTDSSTSVACDRCGHGEEPTGGGECSSGMQCRNKCYWPNVSYCQRGDCVCKRYDSFSNPGCGESTPSCTPTCPSGYEKCTSNCGTDTKTAECKSECPECKNQYFDKITCKLIPPTPVNVCDGGDWTRQIPSNVEEGQSIEIAGYGEDSDGVDPTSVSIAVDGEAVDSVDASVSISDATKTNWSHTISGIEKGEHIVTITWKDNKGLGGSACTLTSSFSVEEIPTNPNWEIEKIGTPACEEGATDDLDKVEVAYVLTITNTGDGEGTIESIVDTLDDKVEASFLVDESITNDGEYSGGVITWTLSGEGATFDPAESKTYQYSLMIPRVSFGTYENRVIATPTEGDSFSTIATIQADCSITPEDIPQTGLFDDASRKIIVGFGFLALGMLYMKFDFVKFTWNSVEGGKIKIVKEIRKGKTKKIFSLRKRFERKVVKDK